MQYPVDMEAFAAKIQRANAFSDRVHPKSSERPVYGKRIYETESSDEEEEEDKREEASSDEEAHHASERLGKHTNDESSKESSEESDGESNDDESDEEGSRTSSAFVSANGKGRKLTPEQLTNAKAIQGDTSDSGHDEVEIEATYDQFDVLNCSFSFRNFDNIRTSDDAVISGLSNEITDDDNTGFLDNILNAILQTDHQFADFTEQPDEGLGEPMDFEQIECELVSCDDNAVYGFWKLKIVMTFEKKTNCDAVKLNYVYIL